jgi:hypothetical protein
LTEVESNFAVYPNPSNGSMVIELSDNISGSVIIQDVSGKNVYSAFFNSDKIQIDLGNQLADGTYFIRIVSEDDSYSGTKRIQIIR